MKRKIVILTEGYTNPHFGKTARNLIYYKPDEVVALFDRNLVGKYAFEFLGVGKDIPIIGNLESAKDANTLLIGVATGGGRISESYIEIILQAIKNGWNIISGLHDFVSDIDILVDEAKISGSNIWDIRKNSFNKVVNRKGINNNCLRIQTVGNDCSLGKMVTSIEINKKLIEKGYKSKFVATGQTGILIEGDGLPIDCIKGDFINGAAEQLVLDNQNNDIMIIEGQGSLIHPRYSSVTLGLLHGALPHALIMCYEMGRKNIVGFDNILIPDLQDVINIYENMANIMLPCKVIGIAINGRHFTQAEVDKEAERITTKYNLPACDVIKHGADILADAIIKEKSKSN